MAKTPYCLPSHFLHLLHHRCKSFSNCTIPSVRFSAVASSLNLCNLKISDDLLQLDRHHLHPEAFDPLDIRSAFGSGDGNFSPAAITPEVVAEVLSREKYVQRALTIFRWAAEQQGYVHTGASYTALIRKLCDVKMFATAQNVLEEMRSRNCEICIVA